MPSSYVFFLLYRLVFFYFKFANFTLTRVPWILVLTRLCLTTTTIYNVENSTRADIVCIIYNGDKPGWSGPPEVNGAPTLYAYYNTEVYNTFNDRLSWAENRRILRLSPAIRPDEGVYMCSRPGVNSSGIQLRVRGIHFWGFIFFKILQFKVNFIVEILLFTKTHYMNYCYNSRVWLLKVFYIFTE